MDIGERVNLFLHSLGAFSVSEESLRRYYESKREKLDREYGIVSEGGN